MADIREHVGSYLDSYVSDPEKRKQLEERIDLWLGLTKGSWQVVTCKHCHRQGKYFIELPDRANAPKALTSLMESSKGKPAQQVAVTHKYEGLPMQDVPTEELLVLAAEEVEEGEFEPLALPAGTD